MHEPLPVGGLDFRDLTTEQRQVAQYAISLKTLKALEKIITSQISDEALKEFTDKTAASKAAADAGQAAFDAVGRAEGTP